MTTAILCLAGAGGGWAAEPPRGGQEVPVPASAYTYLSPLIEVFGDEQRRINMQLPDGGLKPVVGVQNVQLFRSCSGRPDLADGDGWFPLVRASRTLSSQTLLGQPFLLKDSPANGTSARVVRLMSGS